MTTQNVPVRSVTVSRLWRTDFAVPILLVVLSAVPILGGIVRLASLTPGAAIKAQDARFAAEPVPVIVHVLAATLYSVLGAFQFSQGVRRRWPGWHRGAGRLLALCGLCVGFTGLWMTARYPIPIELQGTLLYAVRLLVGSIMVISLVVGVASVLRGDVAHHEAWMIRAYALGQGAGTQALLMLPLMLISGEALGLKRDIFMSTAWVLNWVVAERMIRRRTRASRTMALPSSNGPLV